MSREDLMSGGGLCNFRPDDFSINIHPDSTTPLSHSFLVAGTRYGRNDGIFYRPLLQYEPPLSDPRVLVELWDDVESFENEIGPAHFHVNIRPRLRFTGNNTVNKFLKEFSLHKHPQLVVSSNGTAQLSYNALDKMPMDLFSMNRDLVTFLPSDPSLVDMEITNAWQELLGGFRARIMRNSKTRNTSFEIEVHKQTILNKNVTIILGLTFSNKPIEEVIIEIEELIMSTIRTGKQYLPITLFEEYFDPYIRVDIT